MVSVVVVVGWGRGGPEGSLHYLRQEKCSASFTSHGKTNRVGLVRERKYRGLLNAKGRRGGGVIGNLTVSLTWKASTHIRDILKNSLDLSLFPAMDCVVCFFKNYYYFFQQGFEEMERDIIIGTVMDAKSDWTVSFPPCIKRIITHSLHLDVRKNAEESN